MIKYKIFTVVITIFFIGGISACTGINSHLDAANDSIAIDKQELKDVPSLIVVDIAKQKLQLFEKGKLRTSYTISTSKKGPGQTINSSKTPVGLHKVCEKIGETAPTYGVFKGRKFTGFVWQKDTPRYLHRKDFIVTRILRLEGLEKGINKGYNNAGKLVDSKERAIYIHGTTMEWKLGYPSTIGCIHMRSRDVMKLFDEVNVGTLVYIAA